MLGSAGVPVSWSSAPAFTASSPCQQPARQSAVSRRASMSSQHAMRGVQAARSAASGRARLPRPACLAHVRGPSHTPLTASRRLVRRSYLARAAGAGSAASAEGVQTQQRNPRQSDQHGSPARSDAGCKARSTAPEGMSQFVVLHPSAQHKLRRAACVHLAPISAGCQQARRCARYCTISYTW